MPRRIDRLSPQNSAFAVIGFGVMSAFSVFCDVSYSSTTPGDLAFRRYFAVPVASNSIAPALRRIDRLVDRTCKLDELAPRTDEYPWLT